MDINAIKGKTLILAAEGERAAEIARELKEKGVRALIIMPNCAGSALITRIRDCGAELMLSPGESGLGGAQELAREMHARMENSVLME